MAYGLVWCYVKGISLFTDEFDNCNHEVLIELLAYGEYDLSVLF